MKSIFISVAAYADNQLEYTIHSALKQADHPESLVFGVLNQTTHPLSDKIALKAYPVRLIQINPQESFGAAWARSVIQTLYDNEMYTLQLDSHTVFDHGWDTSLIETLNALPAKSILSNYPYGYTRKGDNITLDCAVSPTTTLIIRPMPDQILTRNNLTLSFHSRHIISQEPVRGWHIAGGFFFTRGDFIQDVPYDPQWYFHGEEQGLTLRAFTHGWDVYHIPRIPLYHLYKRINQSSESHHWHPKWRRTPVQIAHLESRAQKRLCDLVHGDIHGAYGLGTARSIDEFCYRSGIDYNKLTITDPPDMHGLFL